MTNSKTYENDVSDLIFSEFIEMFSPDNFTHNHRKEDNMGSIDESVLVLISKIHNFRKVKR